jgi:hypothetical protein
MRHRKSKRKDETSLKEIVVILASLAGLYIIYQNFLTILFTGTIAVIVLVIIAVIGGYFILPALGVETIAALLVALGLSKTSLFNL